MTDRALGCDEVKRRVQALGGSGENDEREAFTAGEGHEVSCVCFRR